MARRRSKIRLGKKSRVNINCAPNIPYGWAGAGGMCRAEKKYFDRYWLRNIDDRTNNSDYPTAMIRPLANGAAGMLLNGIGKGAGPTQRLGQQVLMKSLDLRISFGALDTNTAAATLTTARPLTVRVVVVYINSPNATAYSSLYANLFTAPGNPETMMNLSYRRNFKVIVDKQIVLQPIVQQTTTLAETYQSIAGGGNTVANIKIRRNFSLETTYTADSSDANSETSMASGALYLAVLTSEDFPSPVGSGTYSSFQDFTYWSRIRYVDA